MEKPEAVKAQIKYIRVDRNQLRWETLDVERLIAEDHPARIIWAVSGRLDVSGFEQEHRTQAGAAGRPCWPARLLVSVWVYSYTLGVPSARGIERMMSHEPGLRWLAANETINHHTLADFRVGHQAGHQAALEDLFAQFLALLEEAGLVDLRTLLQDGTKVRAVAGSRSFHRRKTLEKRLRQARQVVRELDRQARSEEEGMDERRRASASGQGSIGASAGGAGETPATGGGDRLRPASGTAGERQRTGGTKDEACRWRLGTELQRSGQHRSEVADHHRYRGDDGR